MWIKGPQLLQSELNWEFIQLVLCLIRAYNYWCKINAIETDRLPKLHLLEQTKFQFNTSLIVQLTNYIRSCGLPISCTIGELAKKIVAQRILAIDAHKDIAILNKTGTLKWMNHYKHTFQIAKLLKPRNA